MDKARIKRLAIATGLGVAGAMARLRLLPAARGLGAIFTLHQVRPYRTPQPDPNRHLEISAEGLATALETLEGLGYDFIRLEDVPARLASGHGAAPRRPFAVFTLDDAFENTRSVALPVFERFRAPCTLFVCKGFSEASHGLWWETLAELLRRTDRLELAFAGTRHDLATAGLDDKRRAFAELAPLISGAREAEAIAALDRLALAHGIDARRFAAQSILSGADLAALAAHPLVTLGAHTVSHRALAHLPDGELARELRESAAYVEDLTGRRPETFAYPYGDARSVDARTIRAVADAGFRLAVTTRPGTLAAGSLAEAHALPRISLNGHFQRAGQVAALASGIPFRWMRRSG